MADKAIQDLTAATTPLSGNELFVLQQSSQAKKIEAQDFVAFLATELDGHGGIANISYTEPTGTSLDGTITITMADGTAYNVTLANGRGISNITWATSGTAGDGMTHTGTIEYNDGTDSTVVFQDGYKGDTGAQTYVWFKWAQDYPDSDNDLQDSVGPYIGIYAGTSSSAPTSYSAYTWYEYKGETGDTGASVTSVTKSSTSGLIDTYTINLSDGTTGGTFNVTNAKSITSVVKVSGTGAAGTTDVYRITYNNGDTFDFSIYNGANGDGSVSTVSGIEADGNGDVPQVISGNGAPTASTVGQANQLYYDLTGGTMYFCAGTSGTDYLWYGTSVSVDNAFSSVSTNPVQNAVITAKVGTTPLNTTATDLSGAVNEALAAIPSGATTTPQPDGTGAAGSGTTWARSNHVHPLNVATSGVPSNLGTASRGSATTYARFDHVHAMPSASDVGAVSTSEVEFKIYESVTDLGLTAGSATLTGVWSAMPDNSILICNISAFSSSEWPTAGFTAATFYGTIVIIKVLSYRGSIYAYGKTPAAGDWRMYLTDGTNIPTGTWVIANGDSGWITATLSSSFIAYNNNAADTPKYRKIGNIVEITGIVSPSSEISDSSVSTTVFTLPSGYLPGRNQHTLCQGSAANKFLLQVGTSGAVTISRYGTTSFASIPTSAWLPFNMTFFIG